MCKKFISLTKDEIIFIVTDIFGAEKVTNIKVHKREDYISCTIYTKWHTTDDDGKDVEELIPDDIQLRNPFDYGEDAIWVPFSVNYRDYNQLKSYCYAKGIYGVSIDWLTNNPYKKEGLFDKLRKLIDSDQGLADATKQHIQTLITKCEEE